MRHTIDTDKTRRGGGVVRHFKHIQTIKEITVEYRTQTSVAPYHSESGIVNWHPVEVTDVNLHFNFLFVLFVCR